MTPRRLVYTVAVTRPCGNPDHDTLADDEYLETYRNILTDLLTGEDMPPVTISQGMVIHRYYTVTLTATETRDEQKGQTVTYLTRIDHADPFADPDPRD